MTVEESRAGTATLGELSARPETVEKRISLDELGKLMAKVQDLDLKMQDLEAQANLKEKQIKKTCKVKDTVKSKSELKQRDHISAQNALGFPLRVFLLQEFSFSSFPSSLTGPSFPSSKDTLAFLAPGCVTGLSHMSFDSVDTFFSFFERFVGSVTTAH